MYSRQEDRYGGSVTFQQMQYYSDFLDKNPSSSIEITKTHKSNKPSVQEGNEIRPTSSN